MYSYRKYKIIRKLADRCVDNVQMLRASLSETNYYYLIHSRPNNGDMQMLYLKKNIVGTVFVRKIYGE